MSLADDLDAPILVKVGGEEVRLGILGRADLAALDREITEEARDAEEAKLPNTATAAQVDQARRSVGGLTVEGLSTHVFTLDGSARFLARELVCGGSAPDLDAARAMVDKIARRVGWHKLSYLAADASGLFPPPGERAEAPGPNASAGATGPGTTD